MKRDLNLMRQIMLDLEECEEPYIDICTLYQDDDSITDFAKIAYHVRLLEDAGYIETDSPTIMGGYVNYPIKLITNNGYEFIRLTKPQNTWEKIMPLLEKFGKVASIAAIEKYVEKLF